jgi:hypothetical protein
VRQRRVGRGAAVDRRLEGGSEGDDEQRRAYGSEQRVRLRSDNSERNDDRLAG